MNIKWDAKEYKDNFSFVPKYGEDVLHLIEHKAPAFVVDLGCGNGIITNKLFEKGYQVLGIDNSLDMLEQAKKNYPTLSFLYADATTFQLQNKADVIFSNAVFHWINDQNALIRNLYSNLKSSGELVFEFGGYGCAEMIHSTLEKIFKEYELTYKRTFYFPTIAEYAALLEEHGFLVKYAVLFDRMTKQVGSNGLIQWILMFDKEPFIGVKEELKEKILVKAANILKSKLYYNGNWYVDYVRIRMRAIKK